MTQHTPHPDLPPPSTSVGLIGWLRANLFSSWLNGLLTLAAIYVLAVTIPPLVNWAFVNADWVGDSRDACTSGGACWVFVNVRFNQFMYGLYPPGEYWRINVAAILIVLLVIPLFIERFRWKLWLGGFIVFVYPVIAFYLFSGGVFGLEHVETSRWGGLTLTLVLASVGMAASFPLGVLLALGRRSTMPIVRSVSIVFIEFWRGVPLITVLFMSSVMLPLFLPEGTNFDKLLRAMIGIAL
ncbi:MAG: ABC transporter permease subunit, partial [Gammaproteobacteria bacterium]|nr:ABC transporter permease subunit [Gammaproteobacteria bacterium]